MACLEVQRGRRVEESREEESSGEESRGEEGNQSFPLFGCFKNQDKEERKLLKQTNLPLFENGLATLVYY